MEPADRLLYFVVRALVQFYEGWPRLKQLYSATARTVMTHAEDMLLFLGLYKHGERQWASISKDLLPCRDANKLFIRYVLMAVPVSGLAHLNVFAANSSSVVFRYKNKLSKEERSKCPDSVLASFRVIAQLVGVCVCVYVCTCTCVYARACYDFPILFHGYCMRA